MSTKRPMTDFARNEAGLVDNFIGSAYDTVKGVYDNLPEIRVLYEIVEDLPELAETVVEAAMVPARAELNVIVQEAHQWSDQAEQSATDAAASADRANTINRQYPFTFVAGQSQYDVTVISGDPSANTVSLALWVEGAIEYAFTIDDQHKFSLLTPELYLDGAQMRIIVNARLDDFLTNINELTQSYEDRFNAFLDQSNYELAVPYVPGIVLTRQTQTVSYLGELYRSKVADLPFTTTVWATDSDKFFSIGDAALRQELSVTTDGSKASGQIGNSIIVVPTVADMVALTGLVSGKRVKTLGYEVIGDGGENTYLIVPTGTGVVDGGRYISVPGALAKGLFPDGTARSKQYGAKGDNSAPNQDVLIRNALALVMTDSVADASGADVPLKLGAYKIGATVPVLGDRSLRGTAGSNAAKLIAAASIASGSSVLTLPGAFSILERLGIRVDAVIYDPVTNTGTPVDGIKVDSSSSFGNLIRDVRINGGRIGIHMANGFETKVEDSFIVGSNIGVQIDAWDGELNHTIIQDCQQYGVNAVAHGLEAVALHIVRCAILLNLTSNGAPVNLSDLFLDTPLNIGVRFNDQRRAKLSNTYVLKIGNNANASAVGMKFENNSSGNFLIGGSNINSGETFLSVFQFDDSSINNVVAFWHTNSKTCNVAASMRKQTVLACTDDAARYNNIPRKNRGVVTGVVAGATANIVLTLDYTYPALTFNTLLFYGKWVSRNNNSQGAFGDMALPVQFSDTGCAPVVTKTSGHANNSWGVTAVALSGNQLTVTVQNNGTATASISIEIERSLDATGATF